MLERITELLPVCQTFAEIAAELGVSRDRARTMVRAILTELRKQGKYPVCGCGRARFHPYPCGENGAANGIGRLDAAALARRGAVIALLMDGHTHAAIEEMLGMRRKSVGYYVQFLTPEQVIERKRMEEARGPHPGPRARELSEEPDCRLNLYLAGLNDAEIASIVGVVQRTIFVWRKKRGFPANAAWRAPGRVPTDEDLKRLYEMGYSDQKIAAALKIGSSTAHRWRKKQGLPPVGLSGRLSRRPTTSPDITANNTGDQPC